MFLIGGEDWRGGRGRVDKPAIKAAARPQVASQPGRAGQQQTSKTLEPRECSARPRSRPRDRLGDWSGQSHRAGV
jgi:hypothetical protein